MKSVARRADAWLRHLRATLNGGVVPFSTGRFVAASGRPAFAARTYYEVAQIWPVLDVHDIDPDRVLEIGAGYGRLAPWLASGADYVGLEPNDSARQTAQRLYPFVDMEPGVAQSLPFESGGFDLAVSWTVLQHIPRKDATEALSELGRVVRAGGHLLLCERTSGGGTAVLHPRTVDWYRAHLPRFGLVTTEQRKTERSRVEDCTVMLFRHE